MSTSPNKPSTYAPVAAQAFTLLEIVVAMAVFSLIVVSIFGVIDATMVSSGELQDSQRINRETAGFIELCRKTFATLPASAAIRSDPAQEIAPDGQEIVISNAPSIFAWGNNSLNFGTTTLGVRAQENGQFSLSITRSDFVPPDEDITPSLTGTASNFAIEPDDQGRYWLALIPDLQWIQWRFYDPKINDWTDTWIQGSRPHLVELQFLLPDDTIPVRAVFTVSTATAQPPLK